MIFIVMLFIGLSSFGQNTKTKSTTKTPQYLMHVVKFGETLTKIAKNYDVSVVSILNINPALTEDNLNPEQILRIPNTGNKRILTTSKTSNNELQPKVKNKQELTSKSKYHVVVQGQTLYAISKMYNIKVEDLQRWNDLKDFNVKIGSILIIAPTDIKQAETVEKFLKKGSEVAIEGKLSNRNYTDKEGVKRYVTEIIVNEFLMLGGKAD